MKSQFLQPGQTGKPNGGLSLLELCGEVEVDQRPIAVQTTLKLYKVGVRDEAFLSPGPGVFLSRMRNSICEY